MRTVLPIVIAALVAARRLTAADHMSAEDLLALDGPALLKAADEASTEEFSTVELIKIAEKVVREQKNFPDKNNERQLFRQYFDAACEKATPQEIDQLVDLYVRLEPGSFNKTYSFEHLAAAWIARELSTLEPSKVAIQKTEVAPDPEIRNASPELISAWKLYKNAKRNAEHFFGGFDESHAISFQDNEAAFYGLIDDVLRKRGDKLAERLAKFTWSGTCGSGAESLGEPQSMGMFMALLSERRLDEAVGAAIRLHGLGPIILPGTRESVRVAFLKKCGVDWEAVCAGGLLASGSFLWDSPDLRDLTSEGSDRALTFLTELALRAEGYSQKQYTNALAAFFPRDPEDNVWSSEEITRLSPIAVSAEGKKKIIQVLEKFATPTAHRDIAESLVEALARIKSPETKGPLRALLKHPSEKVAQRAATALSALGEVVAAPVRRPVQFRILANGKPFPQGVSVNWGLSAESDLLSAFTETDGTGTIKLPREHFQDERKPTTIELKSGIRSPVNALCFRIRLPVPKNLDAITEVNIEAVPVQLIIEPNLKNDTDKLEALVRIRKHSESLGERDIGELLNWADEEIQTPVSGVPRFEVQKGKYHLEVLLPRAERFRSTFEAASNELRLRVSLRPGGDLRVEIVRPDGEREVPSELFREGRKLEDETVESDNRGKTYRGLAVGHYVLHIPSSAERAAQGFDFAPIQPYAAKDIPFTISGESPLLDLGEVHLEVAKSEAGADRH